MIIRRAINNLRNRECIH